MRHRVSICQECSVERNNVANLPSQLYKVRSFHGDWMQKSLVGRSAVWVWSKYPAFRKRLCLHNQRLMWWVSPSSSHFTTDSQPAFPSWQEHTNPSIEAKFNKDPTSSILCNSILNCTDYIRNTFRWNFWENHPKH